VEWFALTTVIFAGLWLFAVLKLAQAGRDTAGLALDVRIERERLAYMRQEHDALMAERSRVEAARRDLIASVSDELRTPLAGMIAVVETLQSGALHDEPAALHLLAGLGTELDRLNLLVRDLLELSRIESGDIHVTIDQVPLKDVVHDAVERLRPEAERASVRLEIEPSPDIKVITDRVRCEQIFVNLLQNAIKFSQPGGRVAVAWQTQGQEAVAHVQDTGIGIPEDDLPRVFERFYKVDKSRAYSETSGTGLGLAIVKHLASALGGRVGARSTVGQGSDFFVTLPLAQASPRAQQDAVVA
jgi:two-component system, OmpR family, phosphate regulon sensor histidine kinase PhoR